MYGLSAMTGVLPTVVVAGAATMITKSMFGQRPQPTRRKRKRARSRVSVLPGVGFGNFSNVGF